MNDALGLEPFTPFAVAVAEISPSVPGNGLLAVLGDALGLDPFAPFGDASVLAPVVVAQSWPVARRARGRLVGPVPGFARGSRRSF